ncbi:MAG TPA: hypothetical protein VHS09_13325 [Polyangiaceae bacterium]|jgi:hypothetical protein|nr:hypothetical protein [Polyangiaceae bacterium]
MDDEEQYKAIARHLERVTGDLWNGTELLAETMRRVHWLPLANMRASSALALESIGKMRKILDEMERVAKGVAEVVETEGAGAS